tara:strand:+ start:6795 stop:7487 length:693 start_codon:yes stop_codon:yes gene_type:complete
MKFISVIPARRGSKSIKNKNIIKIKNKPLIQYTFDQINKSKLNSKNSFVITNDERVKKIAKKNNINTDYIRPDKLSTSKTSLLGTLNHFVKWTELCKIQYDYLIVLQPTSPLRSFMDINRSIDEVNKKRSKCLLSLSESMEHPYETVFTGKKKKLYFFLNEGKKYFRRQDFDRKSYFINGAIYITSKDLIKKGKVIDYSKSDFIVMQKMNSLDLNDYSELKLIKSILSKK